MDEKIRRLFLCRHGETEANEMGTYCGGGSESPLNEAGKHQAALLGKALQNYYQFRGRFVITSARERARETAEILSRYLNPKPARLSLEGLREIDIGQWCGKTPAEVQKLFPKQHEEWRNGFLGPDFRFPGGESKRETDARIIKCFNAIKRIWLGDKDETNSDLIIIAHAGTNMVILTELLSAEIKIYSYRGIKQENTCVNMVYFHEKNPASWRPETQIALVNSIHHLDMDLENIK